MVPFSADTPARPPTDAPPRPENSPPKPYHPPPQHRWCGPCKLIYPKLVELSLQWESQGVAFVKVDCNADFKQVGKELAIRVAPTFHLYRKGEKVAEMTGAHVDRLKALVEEQMAA